MEPLTAQQMLDIDLFAGDKDADPDLRFSRSKVVRTRKRHECRAYGDRHAIPAGTLARVDEAVLGGEWRRFYSCEPCLRRDIYEYEEEGA